MAISNNDRNVVIMCDGCSKDFETVVIAGTFKVRNHSCPDCSLMAYT